MHSRCGSGSSARQRDTACASRSAINEGAEIAAGSAGWLTWARVGLNFVVPFLVASYGYLTSARAPRPPSPAPGGA